MEQLKHMKEMLVGCVQGQLTHLESVDAKELGEAIDMIKDLSEAIYYCTITDAMEKKDEGQKEMMYYPIYYNDRDMDRTKGRMYYDGNGSGSSSSSVGNNGTRGYSERELPPLIRDYREGRSPMSRKMYMESKEMHKDKTVQMQELEKYMQELTADMAEMIEGATPEEKQILSNRISQLAAKIK